MTGSKILKFMGSLPFVYRNIALACLAITVLLSLVEVTVRKVFGTSIITMNEIGGIGMYLFIAFSISWIYEVRGHLTASFIVDRLSARSRSILELVLHVLTFVFACLVTYLWWRMFISTFESGRYYLITRIEEWPFHLLATTAWGMLGVAAAHSFFTDLKKYFDKTDEIKIGSAVKP